MTELTPLKFHPYLKSVLWGGDSICPYKGIESSEKNIGESWEISVVPGHVSKVSEGDFSGRSLTELIDMYGSLLLGTEVFERYNGRFPLLIKFIDAADNLSVQVHPDDRLALERHGSLGKTEMWYIIRSERGAKIYSGFNRSISPDEYVGLVESGSFADILAVHDSAPGDVFFIPAGRVHAIGAGNMLLEIQESSDVTYRIYDYDRRDAEGNPRELHTELAKDALDYRVYDNYKNPPLPDGETDSEIVSCEHFTTRRVKLDGTKTIENDGRSFIVLICADGEADLIAGNKRMHLQQGSTVLIPASISEFVLNGKATIITTRS